MLLFNHHKEHCIKKKDSSHLKELNYILEEMPAFEKLLQALVSYGMDENKAAQMIADCINEQYELDKIAETLHDAYQDAKEVVINNGNEYKA